MPTLFGVTPTFVESSGDLSGGEIAGIVIGCVAGVVIMIGIGIWYKKRKLL